MVRVVEVTKYESEDGSLHDTKQQALDHNLKYRLHQILLDASFAGELTVRDAVNVIMENLETLQNENRDN